VNNIGDEGAKSIAMTLPQSKLTTLDLYHNFIGSKGVKCIAMIIPQTKLTTLNLRMNSVGDEGFISLAKIFLVADLKNVEKVAFRNTSNICEFQC
jgi:hypothetical protein